MHAEVRPVPHAVLPRQGQRHTVRRPGSRSTHGGHQDGAGESITPIALVLLQEQHAKYNKMPIPARPPGLFHDRPARPLRARAAEYVPANDPAHDDEDDAHYADETGHLDSFSASIALNGPDHTYAFDTWSPNSLF